MPTRSTASGSRPAPSFEGKPFKSVTQGAADLALIPRIDAKDEAGAGDRGRGQRTFIAFIKDDARRRGGGRARLGPADRQRGLPGRVRARSRPPAREAAGRRRTAEIACRSRSWRSIRGTSSSSRSPRSATDERAFKEDAAHLLFDEARVLDGDRPTDARTFSERLARVLHARPSQARRVRLGDAGQSVGESPADDAA